MYLADFYHHHRIHRLAGHSDFHLFELALWIHTVAEALIWVFVPIIFLKTGYSITEILIYSLLFNAIDVPMNFLVDRLIRKIGTRKALILGTFAIIAFFFLLGNLKPGDWTALVILAVLAAMYDTLFWIAHIYLFFQINKEGHLDTGKSTGSVEGVRKLAYIIGPAAGAAILIVLGKEYLIVAAIILFALSMWPLYKMRHVHDVPRHERIVPIKTFFSDKKERMEFLSLAFWGVHSEVDSVLWPLFIFTTIGSIGSVAAVPIIVSLTTAFLSYTAGKLTKRFASAMIAIGSILIAATWLLRISFQDNILYYITVFLTGFFSLLVIIPIDGGIAESSLRKGALSAATYRNAVSMSLRVALYAVLILLVHVFQVSFGIAAVSVFIVFLLTLRTSLSEVDPKPLDIGLK